MAFIEIRSLSHRFADGTVGLEGIDLSVHRGEFVLVAGENGSGKTTLLKHLNGLLLPTSGEVLVDGKSVSADPVRARLMVGMVFQDADAQIVGQTVAEDAAFGPENLGLDRGTIEQRVREALDAVGLTHAADQPPHLLSGGEKRRLAIAGVLAMAPEMIVFDEPFSNLDYTGVRQVLAQMVALHDRGHTLMVTTHDLEKVVAHADRLVVLHRGAAALAGPPAALFPELERLGVRPPCAFRFGKEVGSWLN
jgi:biotin transport system ATP-binding protein